VGRDNCTAQALEFLIPVTVTKRKLENARIANCSYNQVSILTEKNAAVLLSKVKMMPGCPEGQQVNLYTCVPGNRPLHAPYHPMSVISLFGEYGLAVRNSRGSNKI
jgi:hypothetical protein